MNATTLRGIRRARGLTQEQLEALSGVDQTTISRLENSSAHAKPNPETVARLAEALGIAPSELRFSEPQPTPSVDPASDTVGHSPAAEEVSADDAELVTAAHHSGAYR